MYAHSAVYGPLDRYVKLRVTHAPGMPGTFSPPLRVSDPDMHHGMCVTHVPWCMLGLLTSGFLWRRWWGKTSRHSRRMRNPQFYVSGKRPMLRPLWADKWYQTKMFVSLIIIQFRNHQLLGSCYHHVCLYLMLLFQSVHPCVSVVYCEMYHDWCKILIT